MISSITKVFIKTPAADPKEFEQLMTDSYRRVYSLAYRLTSNSADAEDLVQESYIRAFRFFDRYDRALSFTNWMYRIVTNQHIDSIRKNGKMKLTSIECMTAGGMTLDLPDESQCPDRELLHDSVEDEMDWALKAMTPDFRAAVVMADVEGMAYEEIAEVMNTSIGTVRSRIHRGRKQLRSYLEKRNPEKFSGLGKEMEEVK